MAIRRLRGDELENQLNRAALWAVTYGDLMSYLMIFFLLMFSFSVRKAGSRDRRSQEALVAIQKAFGGKAESPALERAVNREKEEAMASKLDDVMKSRNLSQYAKIESQDKKIRLVLSDAVLFDSGRADLKESARSVLAAVADSLGPLANPVVIEGHTDDVPVSRGRFKSNWELSMARAYSVLHFLETHGMASARLSGIGYGEHRPAASNATPEGRRRNRRIEIDLLRTD